MTRQHNWSDNYTYQAARIHSPETVDEVRRIVAGAAEVHAVGSRHSFNGVADSSGDLLDMRALRFEPVVEAGGATVTAAGGMAYGELAAWLQVRGLALHNMASLPHISLAGAVATGTHGSGDRNGTLSSAVAGLELVTASGEVLQVRRGDPGFDGMVVGLGAFGVVTRIMLDVQPSFALRQDAFCDLHWDALIEAFDQVMATGYSVSIMTRWSGPTVNRIWVKTRADAPTAEVRGAKRAAFASSRDCHDPRLTEFGAPGPWSERLCHFRPEAEPGDVNQIQSEYMLPRVNAPEAIWQLRDVAERIDRVLLMGEIRTMAADDLWLSPAYGHDAVALHFSWQGDRQAIDAISAEIEEKLLLLGGRPHWGKLMHTPGHKLANSYPRMADFRALAAMHDPEGKFRNAFLERHIFVA